MPSLSLPLAISNIAAWGKELWHIFAHPLVRFGNFSTNIFRAIKDFLPRASLIVGDVVTLSSPVSEHCPTFRWCWPHFWSVISHAPFGSFLLLCLQVQRSLLLKCHTSLLQPESLQSRHYNFYSNNSNGRLLSLLFRILSLSPAFGMYQLRL